MNQLTPEFWNQRYINEDTPWDIGKVSQPLKVYLDKLPQKDIRILIPGAGKAHEAIYLHQQGFTNVFVCDWADSAFDHLRKNAPNFPVEHQLVGDFFELEIVVDLIVEQTFFCAIQPALRPAYVRKVYELLAPKGKLAGVLFAKPFPFAGPPFGGTEEEYRELFSEYFDILRLEMSEDSIQPRLGNELFIELERKRMV